MGSVRRQVTTTKAPRANEAASSRHDRSMWWTKGAVVHDLEPAHWLTARFGGARAAVTAVVPNGFDAYARILHPIAHTGGPTTWASVAEQTGRPVHPTVGWNALRDLPGRIRVADHDLRDGAAPSDGSLPDRQLAALCDVLLQHTADPNQCFAAVWDGYGWDNRSIIAFGDGPPEEGEIPIEQWRLPTLSTAERAAPRVQLPHHDFYLFAGPLPRTQDYDFETPHFPEDTAGPFLEQSPNLLWPAEHSWCVATDIDFYSTLVGGTAQLIDRVLAHADLEALPIKPTDTLTAETHYG